MLRLTLVCSPLLRHRYRCSASPRPMSAQIPVTAFATVTICDLRVPGDHAGDLMRICSWLYFLLDVMSKAMPLSQVAIQG